MMLLCPGALRDKQHSLFLSFLKFSTGTRTAHTSQCTSRDTPWNSGKYTLPFAWCPWLPESWGWAEQSSSSAQEPLQLLILKVDKTTLIMCSHPTNLRRLGDTSGTLLHAGGVAPLCWQGFLLHLKSEKRKAAETQVLATYLCSQTPSLGWTFELHPKLCISQPLDQQFFDLSSNFLIQGSAFSEESLSPLQG